VQGNVGWIHTGGTEMRIFSGSPTQKWESDAIFEIKCKHCEFIILAGAAFGLT
jgi:hypothetical protein